MKQTLGSIPAQLKRLHTTAKRQVIALLGQPPLTSQKSSKPSWSPGYTVRENQVGEVGQGNYSYATKYLENKHYILLTYSPCGFINICKYTEKLKEFYSEHLYDCH